MAIKYVGQYFFGRHRSSWGIWVCDYLSEDKTSSSGKHVKDVNTYEQAVRETYRLNGWGEPKYIRRTY